MLFVVVPFYYANPRCFTFHSQNKQRKKKKNPSKYGKLTEQQIAAMAELGFKWNIEQGV